MDKSQERKKTELRQGLSIVRKNFRPRNKKALRKHRRNMRARQRRDRKTQPRGRPVNKYGEPLTPDEMGAIQMPSQEQSRRMHGRMLKKYSIYNDVHKK